MAQERLQKVLAAAGIGSRRKCEELILDGIVSVNGKTIHSIPAFADPEIDVIKIRGKKITAAKKVYFLLNKPKGVVCTNFDPQGRKIALDIVPVRERIFCVGRLDIDTSGLIILTNDSELTNRLTHPRYESPKTYVVTVKGELDPVAVEKLKKSVSLAGRRSEKSSVKVIQGGQSNSFIEITTGGGFNSRLRDMLEKTGLNVKSIKRTHLGKIDSKGLGVGQFRPLTKQEVDYLNKITSADRKK